MTELEPPETSPVWWLGTCGATTARVKARLAMEAYQLASEMLGHPHYSAVIWRKDPDQSEHEWPECEPDPEQAPTEPPPPTNAELDLLVAAVDRAKVLCQQFDEASQFALNLARECVELSDEAKREWMLERAELIAELESLRAPRPVREALEGYNDTPRGLSSDVSLTDGAYEGDEEVEE
jgi:hypothetical protein